MDTPILKSSWERANAHFELSLKLASQLITPFTQEAIKEWQPLSAGCANSNYKITFQKECKPLALRIYMRDPAALPIEIKTQQLVDQRIPTAKILYSDDSCQIIPYPWALMEWIDGPLMREVILTSNKSDIAECAYAAGIQLATLRAIKLPISGFFQHDLTITPFTVEEEYLNFTTQLLADPLMQQRLTPPLCSQLLEVIRANEHLLPPKEQANLTHADFDPSNMIVHKKHGEYEIAAILDWEFAFAGSYLLDIGLFLRYSHKLPTCYEKYFIKGIEQSEKLPVDWKKSAKLFDILCLLTLIHSNPEKERPNLNKDVIGLLQHTIQAWDSF